ncbi:hypothetical protein LshimejAT787_0603590 [Lyophyllum shimeji]|uniref:Uncharacterized protein n=1 Tax=Lyophyllum shimeji TaxID=47721 RepID=A0A9P3PPV2_LYOSH|nr:hypothetical protein LshimejAT787_0603590 [Lyophyllum shimeji]
MSAALTRVLQQKQLAINEGVKIIRNIVKTTPAPTGFTTQELYKLALKQPPPPDYRPLTPRPSPTTPAKLVNRGGQNNIKVEAPQPPHPEHPIRSISLLKRRILPILEGEQLLQKARAQRVLAHAGATKKGKDAQRATETVWVWQPVDPSTLPPRPAPEPPKEVYGADVGVGEDWGHLNRRRQRARREKVRADVHAMKVAEGIARYRERATAGAALREKQAQQAALRQ